MLLEIDANRLCKLSKLWMLGYVETENAWVKKQTEKSAVKCFLWIMHNEWEPSSHTLICNITRFVQVWHLIVVLYIPNVQFYQRLLIWLTDNWNKSKNTSVKLNYFNVKCSPWGSKIIKIVTNKANVCVSVFIFVSFFEFQTYI